MSSPEQFRREPIEPKGAITRPSDQVVARFKKEFGDSSASPKIEFIPGTVAGGGTYVVHTRADFSRKELTSLDFPVDTAENLAAHRTFTWKVPQDIIERAIPGGTQMTAEALTVELRKRTGHEHSLVTHMRCHDTGQQGFIFMDVRSDVSRNTLTGEEQKDKIAPRDFYGKCIVIPEQLMHETLGIETKSGGRRGA